MSSLVSSHKLAVGGPLAGQRTVYCKIESFESSEDFRRSRIPHQEIHATTGLNPNNKVDNFRKVSTRSTSVVIAPAEARIKIRMRTTILNRFPRLGKGQRLLNKIEY